MIKVSYYSLYYHATVIRRVWYWYRDRQNGGTELSPEIDSVKGNTVNSTFSIQSLYMEYIMMFS